jgi:hypothetical protein
MDNDNITISGDGVIDMNDMAFFDLDKRDIPDYGVTFTEEQVAECTASISFRPTQPMFFYNCNHIKLQGITVINAPCWTISFNECEDVRVENITIKNSPVIPNNDGIHFCSCKDVIVHGCNISSGDDCIALTGITNWEKPCENVVISDCILRSCSKAVVMGYMHSIIRNVVVSNCIILDSQRAIAFYSSTNTGLVEHVLIENMRLDTRIRAGNWWGNGEPICMFALYHNGEYCLLPVPDRDWKVNIRNVQFKNISCTGENVIGIIGKDKNVQNIHIDGIYMERKESKNRYLKGDFTIDVSPSEDKVRVPDDGNVYWAHIQGCKDIKIDNAYLAPYKGQKMLTSIVDCENVTVNER